MLKNNISHIISSKNIQSKVNIQFWGRHKKSRNANIVQIAKKKKEKPEQLSNNSVTLRIQSY